MPRSKDIPRLIRKLTALPEDSMRAYALSEYLNQSDLKTAVHALDEIYVLGRNEGPPYTIALFALARVLNEELISYELRSRLYEVAKEEGRASLMQIFFSNRMAQPNLAPAADKHELTLGHRKWMARWNRREILDRLLRHPEPEVVAILLDNPRMTERDVVILAARRPTDGDIQNKIFQSHKWITRHAVKIALVFNPYTPTDLTIRLLGLISIQDLQRVEQNPTLSFVVRDAAAQLLKQTKMDES